MMQRTIWILNIFPISQLVQTRLTEKRLPICKGGLFIFLIRWYPQRRKYSILFSLSVCLCLLFTHTHTDKYTGIAGIWASGQRLWVKMAVMGTTAGIQYHMQQACSLVAHAHFSLSQWHWGLTQARLRCHLFLTAMLLSRQADRLEQVESEQRERTNVYKCLFKYLIYIQDTAWAVFNVDF